MRKKGQAALEFLTTYGWAFLVILVMIGALAYFGVLDPTRFLPQRCQFGAELHCDRFSLDGGSQNATFELQNALPDPIYIDYLQYKNPDDSAWTDCTNTANDNAADFTIAREGKEVMYCQMGASTLMSGEKQRIQFKVVYSQGSTQFDEQFANDLFGEVYANVRE